MDRMVLWKVATTTARDALDVKEPEVGYYALVFADGKLYQAVAAGTGSSCWESSLAMQDLSDDTSPQLGGDLDMVTYSIVTTSNRNITLAPHGTGDVKLSACSLITGTNENLTLAPNGTGDVVLSACSLTTGTNENLTLAPNGTGDVVLSACSLITGANENLTLAPNGTGDVVLSGCSLTTGTNESLTLAPNGTGDVVISGCEVTTGANENLVLNPNGTGVVELGANLDVKTNSITTTTSNGSVAIAANGTGGVSLNAHMMYKARVQLTDAANIATNAASGNMFYVTLTDNRVLDNPTNLVAGGWYGWEIIQDGTGSRTLTYGTAFKFRGGAPTLTATAAAKDVLYGYYNGTDLLLDVWLDVKA